MNFKIFSVSHNAEHIVSTQETLLIDLFAVFTHFASHIFMTTIGFFRHF